MLVRELREARREWILARRERLEATDRGKFVRQSVIRLNRQRQRKRKGQR